MKRLLKFIIVIMAISLIGCSKVNKNYSNNIEGADVTSFKYKGTWRVEEYEYLTDEAIGNYENTNIKGALVKLSSDCIEIFNYVCTDVKYKLKVVNKDYIISYEHNIKAEEFMNGRDTIDIISVIDSNSILCEFLLDKNGDIIALANGLLLRLKKVSNDVNFKFNSVVNDASNAINNENNDVGVMIGLKSPRELKDDGTYTEEEYRTIWISYENKEIGTVYEKENIIFPRVDGIWNLKIINKDINNRHYESFEVSSLDGRVLDSNENNINTSVYKSINFVGNDYIAIEMYEGEDFNNSYPINQIVPVNNVNIHKGLSIDELYNNDAKTSYAEEFKIAYNNLSNKEKLEVYDSIDFTSIGMKRNEGRWVLVGNILSKTNEIGRKEFKLPLKPNNKLINFNSLLISWKNLKSELSFIKDAFSAPNGSIILVQFKEYLSIYETDDTGLIGSPLMSIPIKDGEEVIMAEWCEYGYVKQWEKVFVDGEIIE